MILSDSAIQRELSRGAISLEPEIRASDIRQCGVRVHLGDEVLIPKGHDPVALTNGAAPEFETVTMAEEGFLLEPGGYALAVTRESIRTGKGLLSTLDGRSTVARMGLFVHCSSAVLDNLVDRRRRIVLELFNCSSRGLVLKPGDPVAQVLFHRIDGEISGDDGVQYAQQDQLLPPSTEYLAGAVTGDTPGAQPRHAPRHEPEDYDCPFCRIVSGGSSALTTPDDVVLRTPEITAFVASHWWPNNPGGVVIATNRHVENLYDLPDDAGLAVFRASRLIATAMKLALASEGTSTRQHNEPAGGQDVWHFHSHVFPRRTGDRLYELDREKSLAPAGEKQRVAADLRDAIQALSFAAPVGR